MSSIRCYQMSHDKAFYVTSTERGYQVRDVNAARHDWLIDTAATYEEALSILHEWIEAPQTDVITPAPGGTAHDLAQALPEPPHPADRMFEAFEAMGMDAGPMRHMRSEGERAPEEGYRRP